MTNLHQVLMPQINKNIEKAYRLRYSGAELEIALQALAEYPTYKDDCEIKKEKKEALRQDYIKHALKQPV